MNLEGLLLKIKRINTFEKAEQRGIFSELNCWFADLTPQDQFSSLLHLRTYFFKFATVQEKAQFVRFVIKIIKSSELVGYQAMELSGIIFKYVPEQMQIELFSTIFSSSLVDTERGIVSVCSFIKNSNKRFNAEQERVALEYLKSKRETSAPYMQETIDCVDNHLSQCFQRAGSCLFLIPEFQNGSSFLQPPLGLLNAATLLAQKYHISVDILDNRIYNYPLEEIVRLVSNYKAIAVCTSTIDQINTYFVDYRYVINTLYINALKKTYPEIPIVICGAHGTVRPDIFINDCDCDIIVQGEYDIQLASAIKTLLEGEDLHSCPNLLYKNRDGSITKTEVDLKAMHPQNWCAIQPDYGFLHLDAYFGYSYKNNMHLKRMHWSIIQASRGCPYNCAFCYNFYEHKVRYRDIDSVFQEIQDICKEGVEEIFFLDQIFTVNEAFVLELCRRIVDANLKLKWQCQTRVDLINRALIKEMKKAGCETIWLGIESFDETIVDKNNKNYTHESLLQSIRIIDQEGLRYNAFIMLGMMGETRGSLQKTIDTIKENKIHLTKSIMICTPRFDTIMYDEFVKQYGREINSFLELDSYKGRVNNSVTETDLNEYFNILLSLADRG